MSQRLKIRVPIILGLLGSIVGLLYSYAVMSNNGYGCLLCSTNADWSFAQTFIGWPLIIGSVVGLAACVLYPVARKPSGILDRKSTRLNSSHVSISYAVFCLKKKR